MSQLVSYVPRVEHKLKYYPNGKRHSTMKGKKNNPNSKNL